MTTLAIFPSGTEFGDADGVPVSRTPGGGCTAWSRLGPRLFPCRVFLHAKRLTEVQFRHWVDDRTWSPFASGAPD